MSTDTTGSTSGAVSAAVGQSGSGPGAGVRSGRAATVALPPGLQWLLESVVGQRWPQANEDELRSMADVWRHIGDQVSGARRAVEPAAGAVVEYNSGPGINAFHDFWQRYSGGPMPAGVSVCGGMEQMLRRFAGDVAGTKADVLAQLEKLAVELELGVAGSEITLGVSDEAAAAAVAVTRVMIGEAYGELAAKIAADAAGHAARAGATEMFNDATLQTLQQANGGHRFDLGQWAHAGALGAVGGLVGGPVGTHVAALGHPSLAHAAIEHGAEQLGENSAKALADAPSGPDNPDPGETVALVARGGLLGAAGHHAHSQHAAHHPYSAHSPGGEQFLPLPASTPPPTPSSTPSSTPSPRPVARAPRMRRSAPPPP